jgi:hypothetical protein
MRSCDQIKPLFAAKLMGGFVPERAGCVLHTARFSLAGLGRPNIFQKKRNTPRAAELFAPDGIPFTLLTPQVVIYVKSSYPPTHAAGIAVHVLYKRSGILTAGEKRQYLFTGKNPPALIRGVK